MGSKLSSISRRAKKAKTQGASYLQPSENSQCQVNQTRYHTTDGAGGQFPTWTSTTQTTYQSPYPTSTQHTQTLSTSQTVSTIKPQSSHTRHASLSKRLKSATFSHAHSSSGVSHSTARQIEGERVANSPSAANGTDRPSTTGGVRYKVSSAGFHLRPEEDESIYATIPEPRRMEKRPTTHYDRLGISSGATATAVDLAYSKMRRSAGTNNEVDEIEEAYKVLKSIKRRKQYDEEIGIARQDGTRIWRPGEYGHPSQIPTGRKFRKKFPHDTGSYASSRYEKLPRWEKEEIKWD